MALPLFAHCYVGWRLWHLLPLLVWGKWLAVIVVTLLLALAITAVMGLWDRLPLWAGAAAYDVGNTWLIAFLYLLLSFAVLDLGRAVHVVPSRLVLDNWATAATLAVVIGGLLIYGNIHYNNKVRQPLALSTSKPSVHRPMKMVLVSDIHAGYHNRRAEVGRWVDLINAERPDLILIAGDMIDGLIRPLRDEDVAAELRRFDAPVVACLGNHEYITGLDRALPFLREAGITVLRDSTLTINGVTVVGRDDSSNRARRPLSELVADVPAGNYTFVLDHQPYNLQEAESAGIDFQFSGHTHHGQVWPLNHLTDAMYEKAFGEHRRGSTRYYVSSGLGIWGGKYRIATRSEYVVATLTPSASAD